MTKIKICGLSRTDDIEFCNRLKPDFIGFVFFKKSIRNISFNQAEKLKSMLDDNIRSVGVFVNEDISFIEKLCRRNVIDMIQLHGNENDEYIMNLKQLTDKPIIKAVRVKSADEIYKADELPCDFLLLDTYIENIAGGSGKTFDWSVIPKTEKPFFLAGGLDKLNVSAAIKQCSPYAVDVSSSVEENGIKSELKSAEFIKAVRNENFMV